MDIENAKAQMRKGVLEFCILSMLQRGEAYPSDIMAELKESKADCCGRHIVSALDTIQE
jgi:PadR family transcriptional regulator, regulatory protein PadR